MGTTLSDYMENEGSPKTPRSAARRDVFARAYTLAADLIELRQRLGMTQQDLATRSGVAQSEISRIERGVVHPTDSTWVRLAAALDAEVRLVPSSAERQATTP
jgi:XRE family transcriptional regulator, regulator of sulfur utilization